MTDHWRVPKPALLKRRIRDAWAVLIGRQQLRSGIQIVHGVGGGGAGAAFDPPHQRLG